MLGTCTFRSVILCHLFPYLCRYELISLSKPRTPSFIIIPKKKKSDPISRGKKKTKKKKNKEKKNANSKNRTQHHRFLLIDHKHIFMPPVIFHP